MTTFNTVFFANPIKSILFVRDKVANEGYKVALKNASTVVLVREGANGREVLKVKG